MQYYYRPKSRPSKWRPKSIRSKKYWRRWAGGFAALFLFFLWLRQDNTGSDKNPLEVVLTPQNGNVEFSLAPESSDSLSDYEWLSGYAEQRIFRGDSLRTNYNGAAELRLGDLNFLFLGSETEVRFDTLSQQKEEPEVKATLKEGLVWIRLAPDAFTQQEGSLQLSTIHETYQSQGGAWSVQSSEEADILRVWQGVVEVGTEKEVLTAKAGEQITIPHDWNQSLADLPLAEIDDEFRFSEWNLTILERFYPTEASAIRREIELQNTQQELSSGLDQTAEGSEEGALEAPTFLSPSNQANIPADQDAVVISGTAPTDAYQVVVNNYPLSRYQPGSRKWVYNASQRLGTLVPGENVYYVYVVSRDGKRSPTSRLILNYDAPGAESSAENSLSPAAALSQRFTLENINTFAEPTVTKPAVFASGGNVLETSAPIVTLVGTTDPKTNQVKVNDFVLQKYRPGQTEWNYIANANFNMQPGENVYQITAYGPDGKQSSTQVTVIYTPPLATTSAGQ